jgi:hypothetical protein
METWKGACVCEARVKDHMLCHYFCTQVTRTLNLGKEEHEERSFGLFWTIWDVDEQGFFFQFCDVAEVYLSSRN